ncbi:family 10 glycosylhydrolase [Geminisphaera colitermitum]|uniref:family 10 glycosylhydrolase n=1 Tax=Geminisphaera colitermitum TaxID=1148786 RepID=UPI0012FEBD02|nr:family 10 glycosylhydrolase [Geminisphaera colitermitum]
MREYITAIVLGFMFVLRAGGGEMNASGRFAGTPMASSGVVTYSDWMHVFRQDYKDERWFWGGNGVEYIVDRAKFGGMNRLYWRVLNGSCSFAPLRTDSQGVGRSDISMMSQYHYDWPAYKRVYRKPAPAPFQVTFRRGGTAGAADGASGGGGGVVESLPGVLPSGNEPFTIEFRCRVPNAAAGGKVWWFFNDERSGGVRVPLVSPDESGAAYAFFRILVTPSSNAVLVVNHDEGSVRKFPFAGRFTPAGQGSRLSAGFVLEGDGAKLELDKVFLNKGIKAPRDLYPDEPWQFMADYGPTDGSWRDDWRRHWRASSDLVVSTQEGDVIRREDYAQPPLDKVNFLKLAVDATRSRGLQSVLWFSLMEENHYGTGPLTLFARRNPQFREIDVSQREWTGRLSLGWPDVRKYKVALVQAAVAEAKPDGILVDFVRRGLMDPWLERQERTHVPVRDAAGVSIFGYDSNLLGEFEKRFGRRPSAKSNSDPDWIDFRSAQTTRFMRELRNAIPGTRITVLVFSGAAVDSRRGDLVDWQAWAREGLCDEIAFLVDNSTDGRPFVSPFGGQPRPLESVRTLITARRRELPPGFPVTAAVHGYRIDASAVNSISRYAREARAAELMWWETSSLEWADYKGSVWREVRKQAMPAGQSETRNTHP